MQEDLKRWMATFLFVGFLGNNNIDRFFFTECIDSFCVQISIHLVRTGLKNTLYHFRVLKDQNWLKPVIEISYNCVCIR